jgi:drug/metabolite transporter (DMT)-like permease
MTRNYWPLILTLAFAWGASYLFIKVGVDGGFSPAALMSARALLAGVVLLGYLAISFGPATAVRRIRAAWRESLVLGVLNAALPFWLVASGETALAQLILFRVIALFGARRFSLVTYLMPGIALGYGALILDEQIKLSSLIGLALILLGVAIGSGTMRLRNRGASEAVDPAS